MSYTITKYDTTRTFEIGQSVACSYYGEYEGEYEGYRRTEKEKRTDPPFKPVKFGVIVGDAGIHPYWLGSNREEQYLLVRFKEYKLPKPIPISCIQDAKKFADFLGYTLERDKGMIGEKGYSLDAFNKLDAYAKAATSFAEKPFVHKFWNALEKLDRKADRNLKTIYAVSILILIVYALLMFILKIRGHG